MAGFWKRLGKPGRRTGPSSQENWPVQQDDSDWKAVFEDATVLINGPRQIEEVQGRMMNRLSRVYQNVERGNQRHAAFVQGVIKALDYCDGLEPSPVEIRAVRDKLLEVLADQGILPWSPETGAPLPQGCEPVSEQASADVPPGTIMKVARRGYLSNDGQILRRPRVIISRPPAMEIPAPDEAKTASGEESPSIDK